MKSDTERKKFHKEKLHKRKSRLHVHLSKELRAKLKRKTRAVLVRKGDTVRVMRGPGRGKEAKVGDVNVVRRKVFVEGVISKNAKGKEAMLALEPSNLLLLALESTPERREIFSEDAFRKAEPKKEPKPAEAEAKAEAKAETKAGAHAHEHKPGEKHEHNAAHVHGEHPAKGPGAQSAKTNAKQ